MYIKSLEIKNFRCFEQASMEFQYPGRRHGNKKAPRLPNVNLILGDNGSGKSAILKAITLGVLVEILPSSGFRPYLLVRRPIGGKSLERLEDGEAEIRLSALLHENDVRYENLMQQRPLTNEHRDFFARVSIERRYGKEQVYSTSQSVQTPANFPAIPSDKYFDADDFSTSLFVAGYGATRRVEGENFDAGARARSRSLRYQRVTTLFEDYYSLTPVSVWLRDLHSRKETEGFVSLLNAILPQEIRVNLDAVDYSEFRNTVNRICCQASTSANGLLWRP